MPELGPYGSVRGARGNSRPYRDPRPIASVRHQKSLQRSTSGVQLFRSLIRYSITSSALGNVN